jgi:hypothetical protein
MVPGSKPQPSRLSTSSSAFRVQTSKNKHANISNCRTHQSKHHVYPATYSASSSRPSRVIWCHLPCDAPRAAFAWQVTTASMAATGAQSFELMPALSTASQQNMSPDEAEEAYVVDPRLHKRTLLKLDCLLLPFLALLFLFNALDKANVSPTPSPAHNSATLTARRDRLEMPNQLISPKT